MQKFRLMITGSRDWDHYDSIKKAINDIITELIAEDPVRDDIALHYWFNIVHGNCPKGADFLADVFARTELGLKPEIFDANWKKYGKRAGHLRNKDMVDSMPDAGLAFLKDNSPGTVGCRKLAKAAGIPIETIRYEDII